MIKNKILPTDGVQWKNVQITVRRVCMLPNLNHMHTFFFPTYHMILISCDSHELRFSENERAQVILVHFVEARSGASFL